MYAWINGGGAAVFRSPGSAGGMAYALAQQPSHA